MRGGKEGGGGGEKLKLVNSIHWGRVGFKFRLCIAN